MGLNHLSTLQAFAGVLPVACQASRPGQGLAAWGLAQVGTWSQSGSLRTPARSYQGLCLHRGLDPFWFWFAFQSKLNGVPSNNNMLSFGPTLGLFLAF